MKTTLMTGFLAAMVLLGTYNAQAQRNGDARAERAASGRGGVSSSNGVINYQDNSSRNTLKTERDDRKKKAEEEAKKKAEEDKRRKEREEREKRWNDMRNGGRTGMQSGSTTGSKTAAKAGPGRATKPDNKGGSSDPTTREVNEVMLEAVKTQTVNFDPAEAKSKPGILLLNSPKFDGTKRLRAGEKPLVEPL